MNPDPPALQSTQPNLPVQVPTLTPRLKFLLAIAVLILIITITALVKLSPNLLNPPKPTPVTTSATPSTSVNPFPLEKVELGLISEIKPDFIVVKEKSGQKTSVFVSDQTKVRIQEMIPPTKEEARATGSARLIGRIQGNTPAILKDLRVGDEIRITLDEKNNQFWARIITVTRKVKK